MMGLAGVRIMSTFNILYRVFMEIVRPIEGNDMGKIQLGCYVRYGIFGLRLFSALPPCPLRAQRTSKNSQQQPRSRSCTPRSDRRHPAQLVTTLKGLSSSSPRSYAIPVAENS